MSRSPTVAGFRAVLRAPDVFLAQVAWRWSFAVAAVTLAALTFFEYLESLAVTDSALLLLGTRIPVLVGQAVAAILQGSGPRLVRATVIVLLALTALWVVLASLGRQATISALRSVRVRLGPLAGLHFLRAALALAVFVSYLGALLLALHLSDTPDRPRPGMFLLLFVVFAGLISFLHGRVRGFLLLAMVFAQRDTFTALADAVALYRRRAAAFGGVALTTFFLRLALAGGAVLALFMTLGLAADSPLAALIFAASALSLYLLLSDFLNLVQLAAWVAIAEAPDTPLPPPAPPPLVFAPFPPALPPAPLAEG